MDYTKQLQRKLNLAYEVILAYQQWFDNNHIFSIEDSKINNALNNLLGGVKNDI